MKILLFISFCLLFFSPPLNSQNTVTYSSNQFINDVFLESKYAWIATSGGLVRINRQNGNKEILKLENSFVRGSRTNLIQRDNCNNLWIGGDIIYKVKNDETTEEICQISEQEEIAYIHDFVFSKKNELWMYVQTSKGQGLYSYSNGEFINYDSLIIDFLDLDYFNWNKHKKIVLDDSGTFWGAYRNKLFVIKDNKIDTIDKAWTGILYPHGYFSNIDIDSKGKIWLSQEERRFTGFFHHFSYSNDGIWSRESELNSSHSTLQWSEINQIYFDSFNNREVLEFKSNHDFSNTNYHYIWKENNEWKIVSNTKLENLSPLDLRWKTKLMAIDEKGMWWIKAMHHEFGYAVFEQTDTGWLYHNTEIDPLPYNNWYELLLDCESNIWISNGRHLFKFNGDNWNEITVSDIGLPSQRDLYVTDLYLDTATCEVIISFSQELNQVGFAIYKNNSYKLIPNLNRFSKTQKHPNGDYWSLTSKGVARYDGQNWTYFNENNTNLPSYITDLKLDSKGNVWVASSTSYYHFKGFNWTEYKQEESSYPKHLYIDRFDNVFGYQNYPSVLKRFDGTEFVEINLGQKRPYITDLIQDHEGNYWIGTLKGLWKWNIDETIEIFSVCNSDVVSNGIYRISLSNDNKVCISSPGGISLFLPTSYDIAQEQDNVNKFDIFPNPSNGKAYIYFDGSFDFCSEETLIVFDLAGRIVATPQIETKTEIDLPPGIYFAQWSNGATKQTKSIVITH